MITQSSILLIGGTDPSGAGLQTDWHVVNTLQVQASSIVTAVTAQTHEAVIEDGVLSYERLTAQFDSLKGESFAAIKIGMLGNDAVIKALLGFLNAQAPDVPLILDPVLAASSGGALLNQQGIRLLKSDLLPLTTLITPNIEELALLTGLPVSNYQEIEIAANYLLELGAKSVLVKGGHFQSESKQSTDFFISHSDSFYLVGERWQDRKNVRGTGCVLTTALASAISKGYCLSDALVFAKTLISQGIRQAVKVGGQYKFQLSTKQCKEQCKEQYEDNFALKDLPKLVRHSGKIDQVFNFPDCGKKRLGVYPVVDSLEWIKKLVPLGVETIQLRIKDKQAEEVEQDILSAIQFCQDYNTRLFINDYWQLAIKHSAYGIHLGQEDLNTLDSDDLQAIANAGCRLGVSTHSYTEVARAHHIKPSYLALGPIFATTSKVMPWIPQGVAAVAKWHGLLGKAYPLVAIGGIDLERAKALKQTGVGSVAMISAITHTTDYTRATRELMSLWDDA